MLRTSLRCTTHRHALPANQSYVTVLASQQARRTIRTLGNPSRQRASTAPQDLNAADRTGEVKQVLADLKTWGPTSIPPLEVGLRPIQEDSSKCPSGSDSSLSDVEAGEGVSAPTGTPIIGSTPAQPTRSWLYVPASTEKFLEKSLSSKSDVIIYDLEDSVPPSPADKMSARGRLVHFIGTRTNSLPHPDRLAVRLNANSTPFFSEDLVAALRLPFGTLVLPKVHSADDLDQVSEEIFVALKAYKLRAADKPVRLVASIESARSVFNLKEIASWRSRYGPELGGELAGLLFAAEDYCADTSTIRTHTRQELLFTRSQIVVAAKAFKLSAIDMVCVNYKDLEYLKDECDDGRRLGFTGKQAIHPSQVDVIQSTFVPSAKEILRAAKILKQMEKAHAAKRGAVGLALEGGGMEMIDAPMLKQAENVMQMAKTAGLQIPEVE